MTDDTPKRGFAAMTPERRREIAKKGGKATPSHLRSFSTNRDLAKAAGSKGGLTSRPPVKDPADGG